MQCASRGPSSSCRPRPGRGASGAAEAPPRAGGPRYLSCPRSRPRRHRASSQATPVAPRSRVDRGSRAAGTAPGSDPPQKRRSGGPWGAGRLADAEERLAMLGPTGRIPLGLRRHRSYAWRRARSETRKRVPIEDQVRVIAALAEDCHGSLARLIVQTARCCKGILLVRIPFVCSLRIPNNADLELRGYCDCWDCWKRACIRHGCA